MKGLVLYPKADLTQPRDSYLDERYFRLLARRFQAAHASADIRLEEFDEDDSEEFFGDLGNPDYQGLDVFAYIGHGGQQYLYSADVGGASAIGRLATALTEACNDNAVIVFYACNAGRLNDSILRTVYLSTIAKRFRLYGHSTSGRAGNNPNKTVFPPANGAMLIDACLGDLARAPRFRRAWNYSFGNEADDLWATFFLLTDEQLLRRACRPVLARAAAANRIQMRSLGWNLHLDRIYALLGVSERDEEALALGIARWQIQRFSEPSEADGILGRNSWQRMQQEL